MFAQRGTNSDPFPLRSQLLVSFAKGGGGKKKEVESTSPIRWAAGEYMAVRVIVFTTALMLPGHDNSPSRAASPGAGRSPAAFLSVQIYVLGLGRAFVLSLMSNAACAYSARKFHMSEGAVMYLQWGREVSLTSVVLY